MAWKHVRGHDTVVEAFARARQRGRLAHAYLFAGPSGVGKRKFAGELAKALLCESPPNGRFAACDRCPSCLLVQAGTHPDVILGGLPEGALEVPIEVIREMCRGFSLKPARGHGKVAILDDADDLNEAAANCFLKTLEEPPSGSVLTLVGTSPDRQLPTIVSRCQVVRFAPLAEPLVTEVLREQGMKDGPELARLVRLSGGSPGQGLALADPALWEFRRALLEALTAERVDGVELGRRWIAFVEEAGKEAAVRRQRAAMALRLLVELFEDALRLQVGGAAHTAEGDDLTALSRLAEQTDGDHLLTMLERCLEADRQIDRRVQLDLVLEALTDALGRSG
jgi:DNA polymerase-3 subunit delta'